MFLITTNRWYSKKTNKKVEEIDFVWLLYMYTTLLGHTEEEFWNSNLDKVVSLAEKHAEINDPKKAKQNKKYTPNKAGVEYTTGETEVLMAVED